MAKYRCKVCGYIHEGDKAPDVCPVCSAPASEFELVKEEGAAGKKKGLDRDSNAYTIIYASVMVVLVAVVLAFTSQSLRTYQQKNEQNDKRQQILRSINVTVSANEAEAKYNELITDAFLINENGEKVGNKDEAFAGEKEGLPVFVATASATRGKRRVWALKSLRRLSAASFKENNCSRTASSSRLRLSRKARAQPDRTMWTVFREVRLPVRASTGCCSTV